MTRRHRTVRLLTVSLAGVLALSACTTPADEPADPHQAQTSSPPDALTVVASGTDVGTALGTSRALFTHSPVVIVAPTGDADAAELAAGTAVDLGVPLLIAPAVDDDDAGADSADGADDTDSADGADALATELDRLGVTTVVAVGDVGRLDVGDLDDAAGDSAENSGEDSGVVRVDATADALATAASEVPTIVRAEPLTDMVALAIDDPAQTAAIATAEASGIEVLRVPASTPNPQATPEIIEALHASPATKTLAIGAAYNTEPALEWKIRTAKTGAQLPGGGQLMFPTHQFVALYGAPGTGSLGVLGEQDAAASVQRARDVAAPYTGLTDKTVVPMFEIIATVAAGAAGSDGDYSNELEIERLRPWIDAATEAGMYVVIDLQPGRTDFLTQAKRYQSLLELPNVGLAIDPEWRLAPDQVPLEQIGSVSAAEVNAVTAWLADLTNTNGLPQKMVVLHQFQLKMLQDRSQIDTSRPELAMLIHADGQGAQPDKQATWSALHQDAPAGIAWGWKNFYDEDAPMLTPEQTVTAVSPLPDLITYQ